MALNANALCTVDDIKTFFGIDDNVATEEFVEDLINRVSKQFETYCDKNFVIQSYTDYLDGDGGQEIFPKQYPITTVSGIWSDTSWVWNSGSLVDSDTYRIVDSNRVVRRAGSFSTGAQAVKITYTAGYHQGDIATYDDVPLDLRQACIKEVTRLFRDRTNKGISKADIDSGPGTYNYDYVMEEFEPETRSVLNRYRRKAAF